MPRERPLRRDEVMAGTRVAVHQNAHHVGAAPGSLGTIQTVDSIDSFLVIMDPPAGGRVWLGRADVWPLRPRGHGGSDDRFVVGDRRVTLVSRRVSVTFSLDLP